MPQAGPTPNIVLANTPNIQNVSIPSANTEVQISLPVNTRILQLKTRAFGATIKFAFIVNQSGTTYITVLPGTVYSEINLDLSGVSIYLQTDKPSQIIEVLSWSNS